MSLKVIRRLFAEAAQEVYDSWHQDEDGCDDEVGTGGICDRIAESAVTALMCAGYDATTHSVDGNPPHTRVLVDWDGKTYNVDIPYHIYEEFHDEFTFLKLEGVRFSPKDVEVWRATERERLSA